jgi:hypothetical protein
MAAYCSLLCLYTAAANLDVHIIFELFIYLSYRSEHRPTTTLHASSAWLLECYWSLDTKKLHGFCCKVRSSSIFQVRALQVLLLLLLLWRPLSS